MQFTVIEESSVVLYCNGVFRQAKLYLRKKQVYARWSSGFIVLTKSGTSIPQVSWDKKDIVLENYDFSRLGRMVLK